MVYATHHFGEWHGQTKKFQGVDFLCESLRSLRLCGE
jgi:hypothetical protein